MGIVVLNVKTNKSKVCCFLLSDIKDFFFFYIDKEMVTDQETIYSVVSMNYSFFHDLHLRCTFLSLDIFADLQLKAVFHIVLNGSDLP